MNKSVMRIIQDIYDFNNNKPDGIYLHIDKKNVMKQYALIIGPSDTPYFGGYFFFEIEYPQNYPETSPKINFLTVDNHVRFNPNLYENGKVCLSILGTWSGPSWSPVMNIRLVLDSIRSLLGPYPIQNEPGHDKTKPTDISSIEYNQYLIYHTYRLAIVEVLNDKYKNISDKFLKEITIEFENNKKKLEDDLLSYEQIYGDTIVENRVYFMKQSTLPFSKLIIDFNKLIKNKN
jgi:ubiquitin-conjugating enzyme E2 Z